MVENHAEGVQLPLVVTERRSWRLLFQDNEAHYRHFILCISLFGVISSFVGPIMDLQTAVVYTV